MSRFLARTGKSLLAVLLLLGPLTVRGETDYALIRARRAFKTGWTHYQRGAFSPAIESFHQAVAFKPSFMPARVWLGQAYLQAGYPENAAEEWQTATALGLDDNILRQKLAYLLSSGRTGQLRFDPVTEYSHTSTLFGHDLPRGAFHKPSGLLSLGDNILAVAGFLSRNVLLLDINAERTGSLHPGLRPFGKPYGLGRTPDGTILVTDFGRDRVLGFNRRGDKVLEFGGSGIDDGLFSGPEGVTADREGNIFVVDTGNSRVQKFSPSGGFLMSFGNKGRGPDELYRPSGVAVDARGAIFVSDTGNARIQNFDADGNHTGTIGSGILTEPRGLRVKDGLLVVADGPAGLYFHDLKRGLSWTKSFWNGGEFTFQNAMDVEFDPGRNTLTVADFGRNSIEIFSPSVFQYSDLHVDIRRMHTTRWPETAVFLTVSTRDGRPVEGLTEKNFRITEDNSPVSFFSLDKSFRERTSFLFLVERSTAMQRFPLELRAAAEQIVDRRTDRDWFKVLNAGDRVWTGLKYSQSRLTILGRVEKDIATGIVRLGRGLYQAVAELLPLTRNKAVVLFTTGSFGLEEAFQDHSPETILAFAKANSVPLHIVAFTEENRPLLEKMARETGGEYFYYFADAARLTGLYASIAGRSQPEYVLAWKTSRKTARQKWRNLDVRVDVRSQTGRDKSGYFLP